MLIHLFDVITTEGRTIRETCEFSQDQIVFRDGTFKVMDKSPIELKITNTGKKVLEIVCQTDLRIQIPCDRCLEDTVVDFPLSFTRKVDMSLSEEERINDLDESSFITATDLDVDQLIYLEVLMNWPLKTLCRPDCKGICSRCGRNLNQGACDCTEEPKDPRMAAISDIFRKFKEEV